MRHRDLPKISQGERGGDSGYIQKTVFRELSWEKGLRSPVLALYLACQAWPQPRYPGGPSSESFPGIWGWSPQLGVRHYLCASVSPYAKWWALYTCPGVWEPGGPNAPTLTMVPPPGYHSCLGSSTALLHSPSILGCEMGTHLSWGSKRWVWGFLGDSLTLSKTQEWMGVFLAICTMGTLFCSS